MTMNGNITGIDHDPLGMMRVSLSTPYGNITGRWIGKQPVVGDVCYVEVDVDRVTDIRQCDEGTYRLESDSCGEIVTLVGDLEERDNFIAFLRIGSGLLQIEADCTMYPLGMWLCVHGNGVALNEVNL